MEAEHVANRQRFIATLRSGKYHQVFGKYLDPWNKDCMCAVGVAAVTCGNERVAEGETTPIWFFKDYVHSSVIDGLGIDYNEMKGIIVLNDEKRLTFDQIADRLEERWQLLSTAEPSA